MAIIVAKKFRVDNIFPFSNECRAILPEEPSIREIG